NHGITTGRRMQENTPEWLIGTSPHEGMTEQRKRWRPSSMELLRPPGGHDGGRLRPPSQDGRSPQPAVCRAESAADRDVRASAALVALGGHDHVVLELAEIHPCARPGVEVVPGGDGAGADHLRLADAPVLVEGARALDGGGVVPRRLVDVVRAAVAVHGAAVLAGGPVAAPVVDDVVLHQRVRRPAVEAAVAVARGVEVAAVADRPAPAVAPALAGDEVAAVGPLGAVTAAAVERHGDGAAAVRPERVVHAVVAGLVGGDGGGGVGRAGQQQSGRGRERDGAGAAEEASSAQAAEGGGVLLVLVLPLTVLLHASSR